VAGSSGGGSDNARKIAGEGTDGGAQRFARDPVVRRLLPENAYSSGLGEDIDTPW